jgi:hypothetical protein
MCEECARAAYFATAPFLRDLEECCHRLEELSLRMVRSRGNAIGVAVYRAIGSMPNLRKVHLSTMCSEPITRHRTMYKRFRQACDNPADLD